MAVSDLHRQVAAVALAAAAQHGFALGGGNALLAHGLTTRPTQDVDLFTDQEHGVDAAAAAVEEALAAAGLQAERQDDTAYRMCRPDSGKRRRRQKRGDLRLWPCVRTSESPIPRRSRTGSVVSAWPWFTSTAVVYGVADAAVTDLPVVGVSA